MGKSILNIDASDAIELAKELGQAFSDKAWQQVMFRVMKRVAPRTRKLVKEHVPVDYHAKGGWVGGALGNPNIQTSGMGASCIIPVDGARGRIGKGGEFKASATGAGGGRISSAYEGRKGKRSRRVMKITAQIVKSGASTLPTGGDRPHIMIMGKAGHVGGVYVVRKDLGTYMATVHRRTKTKGVRTYRAKKNRIATAVGIGVPQMPLTRSADKIQQGVSKVLFERVEHEFEWVLQTYAGKHMG